jgi:uncharacterized integral membrane protein (TIGR00698 family)
VKTDDLVKAIPGLLLAVAIVVVANPAAHAAGAAVLRLQGLSEGKSPVSPIPVAVVLGLLVANTLGVPKMAAPGLSFATKNVLRLGIILVGLKLSVLDVLQVGLIGVPIVVALVAFALAVSLGLARAAGVGPRLGVLAAASTAICGITATLAVAPGIKADDREVAYTVANVTLFGLCGMILYPYVAHALFGGVSGSAGLFLGTAIHDTSQVLGAAMSYSQVYGDERAMQVATVAKLTRNSLLVVVVPFLTWAYRRTSGAAAESKGADFPTFVLGFVAMAVVRTAGDAILGADPTWKAVVSALGDTGATLLLACALAAVGLGTKLSTLRGLGPRPMAVGLTAALAVGAASAILSAVLGGLLS